jgi:hypothetical protein
VLLDAGNAGAQYNWQNGLTSQQVVARQQGLYHVVVTKDGCVAKDSVSISLQPLPVVSISGNTTICRDGATTLTASGGATFAWTPSTALSSPTAAVTTASPVVSTKYIVTAKGTNGCKAKDSVMVTVTPRPVFSAFAANR